MPLKATRLSVPIMIRNLFKRIAKSSLKSDQLTQLGLKP